MFSSVTETERRQVFAIAWGKRSQPNFQKKKKKKKAFISCVD